METVSVYVVTQLTKSSWFEVYVWSSNPSTPLASYLYVHYEPFSGYLQYGLTWL